MVRTLIAKAFSALKGCVHFPAAPKAIISVIGGEETISVAKTDNGLGLSRNALINCGNV